MSSISSASSNFRTLALSLNQPVCGYARSLISHIVLSSLFCPRLAPDIETRDM